MKKFVVLAGAAAFFLASCVGNPDGNKAETTEAAEVTAAEGTELTVNTETSKIEWLGKKVTGEHKGDIKIKSGTVTVKDGQLSGGNIVVDMNSLNDHDLEGSEFKAKLEGHLKSADFFDVENHPEATLEITNVQEGATAGTISVSANLTIRGVTKNITFDAQVAEATDSSFKATADFNIERMDWGVAYEGKPDDLISKQINFKVSLDASK